MIEERNPKIGEDFSEYRFNLVHKEEGEARLGIITHGSSYELVMEALEGFKGVRVMKVSTPNPMPEKLMLSFVEGLDEIIAIEELDPVLENALLLLGGKHHLSVEIRGKMTKDVQPAGENTVESITKVLESFLGEAYIEYKKEKHPENACAGTEGCEVPPLPVRPPVLCAGCPHRASFYSVKRAIERANEERQEGTPEIEGVYCGDIGCYTLGNAKPLDMTDTCLCMGAGITMAQGLQRIEPGKRYFSFVGDSTFFAAGITGIVNAVYNEANITVCILDNSTTAMTGHQPHPGTGRTMMGQVVEKVSIRKVLEGIGVKEIATVDALNLEECVNTVKQMSAKEGVKAIIFKSPCIALSKPTKKCRINEEECVHCRTCINEIGCPALVLDGDMVRIDAGLCSGCGLCSQICSVNAIETVR